MSIFDYAKAFKLCAVFISNITICIHVHNTLYIKTLYHHTIRVGKFSTWIIWAGILDYVVLKTVVCNTNSLNKFVVKLYLSNWWSIFLPCLMARQIVFFFKPNHIETIFKLNLTTDKDKNIISFDAHTTFDW